MQGQRETNASNTSLIDDIYDDIMLNEEKRKKTYNIKDYSIKVVEKKEEEEQPKEHGIFKNIKFEFEKITITNGVKLRTLRSGPVLRLANTWDRDQFRGQPDAVFREVCRGYDQDGADKRVDRQTRGDQS